jgi:drug/metabolite transporter (DMT)-like permease
MNRTALIDWTLILAIGVAWGASFLFIKVAASAVGPISLVFYRLFIASLMLAPIFIKK